MSHDPQGQLGATWQMAPHILDINAARSSPAVLITGPAAVGHRLAMEIAAEPTAEQGDAVVVVEARDRRCLQRALSCAVAGTGGLRAIVVYDVDALDAAQQAAFLAALTHIPRYDAHACRIIATTAIWLFDRVLHGSFNPRLFYRLNTVHIRLDIDRAAARGTAGMLGNRM
jgi:hypothetical protein